MFPSDKKTPGNQPLGIPQSEILDGASNTIAIAETREEKAAVWIDGTSAAVAARALGPAPTFASNTISINFKPYFPGGFPNSIVQDWGPSSMHPSGAHHWLCDGSVRYLLDTISVTMYDSLMTRRGGEVAPPP
jgi:hypothetical protein